MNLSKKGLRLLYLPFLFSTHFLLGNSDTVQCTVVEVDVLSSPDVFVPQSRACINDHVAYDLRSLGLDDIKSGTTIKLKNIILDEASAKVVQTPGSQVEVIPMGLSLRRRKLTMSPEKREVMVIRVVYRGKTPRLSTEELAGRVFGLGNEQVGISVSQQFRACSFGKIEMRPFRAVGVENGVAEVSISTAVSGSYSVLALQNLVFEQIKVTWQESIKTVDHFLLVMPDAGLKYFGGSYLAYAYLNSDISVYHDLWGGRLSAVMHEIGHNFGLHHSGQGALEYGDRSGYMGYGTVEVGGPAMCFNAQKNWSLGWFDDRMIWLDVRDLPWGGTLSTFVDYDETAEGDYVVMRLGGRKNVDSLFLQYNRKKGINSGTAEFGNRVSIVKADLSEAYAISSFVTVTAPNANGFFRYNNFEKTGYDLIIKGCTKVGGDPEGVRLSVYLDDGVQHDNCNDELVLPRKCADLNTKAFYVDEREELKKCSWLRRKSQTSDTWPSRLCKPGHSAYLYCQETCRSDC